MMTNMVRKFFVTIALMLLIAAPAYADVFLPAGLTTIEDQTFSGAAWISGACKIPEGVTSIGTEAFSGCSNLTELTIPASVTTIKSGAFKNCSGLTGTLVLSADVNVAADAFEGCNNLTVIIEGNEPDDESLIDPATLFTWTEANGQITIDDYIGDRSITALEVPSHINGQPVTAIAGYAFAYDRALTTITLPETLTTIGDRAFASCSALKEVSIPASVKTIGKNAFYYCRSLNGSISLIDADVASNAFTGSQMAVYSYTTNTDGTLTLSRCTGSIATANIPATVAGRSVTAIGREAFSYSTRLQTASIPAGVKTIGNNAFYYCTALTSVSLPDSVTAIGANAFRYCTALTDLNMPADIQSIGMMAFDNCKKLSGTYTLIDVELDFAAFSGSDRLTVFCYSTSGNSLMLENCFSSETSLSIPAQVNGRNVTDMAPMAFAECYDLERLSIPATFTAICDEAFSDHESLTAIDLPNTITTIGVSAFENCTSLSSITLSGNVRTVKSKAFNGCTSLTSLTITSANTVLENSAFNDCYRLSNINMPEGFSNVGSYALSNTAWMDAKIATIARSVTAGCSTDEQKARVLHDWVVDNSRYDESYTYYGVEGIIFHGTGVCNSYTLLYHDLLNAVGITNHIVTGTATNNAGVKGSHAWNLVLLNGDWYHIDTTWDDPLPNGRENRTYYCMTDAQLAINHHWNTADYPAANGTLYGAAATRTASR